MSVLVVGVSHRSAPVEVLDRCGLTVDEAGRLAADVAAAAHVTESVVLSTCNRVEVYADVTRFHGGVEDVSTLLATHASMDLGTLLPYLYVHYEQRAVAHLFAVTAGLDSLVVGESQVLGQVREALRRAQRGGTAGRALNDLVQSALHAGKRAHAETGVDRAGRTLLTDAFAAAEAAGVKVAGTRCVVVGAGSMAALAATSLAREGAAQVVVVNRSRSAAVRLAESVGGRVAGWERLDAEIAAADVVVSCTGAAGTVIGVDAVVAALTARRTAARPGADRLTFIDLALPHDIAPEVGALAGAIRIDLATLAARRQAAGADETDPEVEAVRQIVAQETHAYAEAQHAERVAPTVVALRAMADDVVTGELDRLANRVPELDPAVAAELASTVRRVVDKLLHQPTVRVKQLSVRPNGVAYEDALRELFQLDPRAVDLVTQPDTTEGGVRA